MNVIDLVDSYLEHVVENADWSGYEAESPALFRHYFRFWAKRKYPDINIAPNFLKRNTARIKTRLPAILGRFHRKELNVDDLTFFLFVGKNCSNGHAFFDVGNWVVWLPVESYVNSTLVDVFVTHEIAHALHYQASPGFYFHSVAEQRLLGRQLITEGLATWMTIQVLECSEEMALWGGYLDKKHVRNWMKQCDTQLAEMKSYALKYFESSRHAEFFQYNVPDDIFKARGGYFLGLKLIDRLAQEQELSAAEIVRLPCSQINKYARKFLG